MSRKTALANFHVAVCKLLAVTLLLTLTTPAFARPAPAFRDDRPVFDITPATGAPGREYTIQVLRHESTGTALPADTQLVAPGEITVSGVTVTTEDSLSAKIGIPQDAPIGKYRFLLKNTDNKVIGIADFEVTAIGIGPYPTATPEVDVMWGVMPKAIVRHNFGRQVANNYYGVQIRIGNDSGYDLQLAGVGFKLRDSALRNTVPTNSYRATRGTLELDQQIGVRASLVNAVKAFGTLYSGFLPFWHMPNRKANANLAGDIINGPFEAGLELVAPDLTTRQLTRLDDQTLRDGLIIKNNSQIVTLVWIAKKVLNLEKDAGRNDNNYITRSKRENEREKDKDWSDDPQYVAWRLGEMAIVGEQIKYINRVQLLANSEGGGVTPPPTVTGVNPPAIVQGQTQQLTIPGAYLTKATPTLNDPATHQPVADVQFPETSVDPSGHILTTKVTVGEAVEPGSYTLVISSPGGSIEKTLIITQAPPSVEGDITYNDTPDKKPLTASTAKDQEVEITIKGKHFSNAKLILPKELSIDGAPTVNDNEITAKIKVPKATPANDGYVIQIKNANPQTASIKFKVAAAP